MNANTTISITEARKRIFDIAREVQKPSVYYTLTENGRPKAVMLAASEFESWQETLEVMRDFLNLKDDAKRVYAEYKKGDYITLEELLASNGFTPAKTKKYALSDNIHQKRPKGAKKNRKKISK